MKPKDKTSLHQQTLKQLQVNLAKAQTDLVDLRFKLKTNQLKDTSQLKKTRHQIAVFKTLIYQKQTKPKS